MTEVIIKGLEKGLLQGLEKGPFMRHPNEEIMPAQPIRHLWPRHQEIIRRVVSGERPKDIAAAMGITESRLSIILKSPMTQERVQYLMDEADGVTIDIKRRLRWLSQQSMDILEEALTTPETEGGLTLVQKVRVAQDQLDRDGYGKVSITRGENVHLHVTSNDIEEMKSRINGKGPVDRGTSRRLFGRTAGMSPAGKVIDVGDDGPKSAPLQRVVGSPKSEGP